MTLLITLFAAIIVTLIWYSHKPNDIYKISILCFLFWGASIMWFVDAIFEYSELKAAYFTPQPIDMLNDTFLGFSVVALGLVIWIVSLLIRDPKKVIWKK